MLDTIVQTIDSPQDGRRQRGLEIAATTKLIERYGEWIVPSQSGRGNYRVHLGEQRCACPTSRPETCLASISSPTSARPPQTAP